MARVLYKASRYNIPVNIGDISLIFNSSSGAIVRLEPELLSKLMNENCVFEEIDQCFESLKREGLIVPYKRDEFSILQYDKNVYTFDQSPKLIGFVIAPTMGCNLNCPYCFEAGVRENRPMSKQTWDDVYEFITKRVEQHPSVREVSISWFGGEPCLQIDQISAFSEKLIKKLSYNNVDYQARIVTNGVLLNEEVAKKLQKAMVKKAQITIDGLASNYAQRKGCKSDIFYKVIKNIITATKYMHVNIRINLDNDNLTDVESLLQYLLDDNHLNGIVNITPAPVRAWNKSDTTNHLTGNEYLAFLKKMHDLILKNDWEASFAPKRPARRLSPCGSIRNTNGTIGPDGQLYRCEHCLNRSEWSIGSVSTGEEYNNVDLEFMHYSCDERCSSCKGFPICVGGCVASRLLHHVEPEYCDQYLDIIKENVRFAYLSKIKKKKRKGAYEDQLTPWGFDYNLMRKEDE